MPTKGTNSLDAKVLEAQKWVNATYGQVSGYKKCAEDGFTGQATIYSLTRALQIELGITSLSDNFETHRSGQSSEPSATPVRPPPTRTSSPSSSTASSAAQPHESNYSSETAIAIRPNTYPLGISGGLFPHELIVIRDILAEYDGVVRWGGDERVPKESHFQVDVPPGDARIG